MIRRLLLPAWLALSAAAAAAPVEAPVRAPDFALGYAAPAAAGAFAASALKGPAPLLAAPYTGSAAPSALAAAAAAAPVAAIPELAAPGPQAPDLAGLEAATRALFRRYLPELDRPLSVRFVYEDSMLGAGGGHTFTPEAGHEIGLTPGETDADGEVVSAFGPPGRTRVQPKIEQIATSVHEFAHAVFDEAVGRRVAARPRDSAYDAMTEGFAVKCERIVLQGMLRDADELGLSARDVADIQKILEARLLWLKTEDNAYAEGTPVWHLLHVEGGGAAMASFLESLRAERLMNVMRSDPVYQLSLGRPETAGAYLGDDSAPLRAGLKAASAAAAGRALSPAEADLVARAVDAAGPAGRDWLIRRALLREVDFGADGWIVPAFLRRAPDLSAALFRLAALNQPLARRVAEILHWAASTPEGLRRVFEVPGPSARFMAVVAEAEKLPWSAPAKRAWDAAVLRWMGRP